MLCPVVLVFLFYQLQIDKLIKREHFSGVLLIGFALARTWNAQSGGVDEDEDEDEASQMANSSHRSHQLQLAWAIIAPLSSPTAGQLVNPICCLPCPQLLLRSAREATRPRAINVNMLTLKFALKLLFLTHTLPLSLPHQVSK